MKSEYEKALKLASSGVLEILRRENVGAIELLSKLSSRAVVDLERDASGVGVKEKKKRASSAKRGYGYDWRKKRAVFLKANPWCVICLSKGRRTRATVPDHIIPHKGDPEKFNDQSNWQALCKRCHDHKTATKDGGGWQHARYSCE